MWDYYCAKPLALKFNKNNAINRFSFEEWVFTELKDYLQIQLV